MFFVLLIRLYVNAFNCLTSTGNSPIPPDSQEIPRDLLTMAERYKAMRERRGDDFKERRGGRNQWRREGQNVDFGGKGSKW